MLSQKQLHLIKWTHKPPTYRKRKEDVLAIFSLFYATRLPV